MCKVRKTTSNNRTMTQPLHFIVIRGLGRDQLQWQPFVDLLQQAFPEAIIHRPDLPGAGTLFNERSPSNISAFVTHIRNQVLPQLGKNKAILIGLSLGGMISLEWGALFPNEVEQVIPINSSSRHSFFMQRLKVWKALAYPGILMRWNLSAKEKAIYQITCNTRPINQERIELWTSIQTKHPVSLLNQLFMAWAGLCFKAKKLNQVKVSVLVAEGDRFVAPRCSEKLATLMHAPLFKHPWGGHDLTEDDPQWVVDRIRELIKSEQ